MIPTVHWILGLVSGGCDEWYRMRAEEGGQLQIAQFQAVTECGKLKKYISELFCNQDEKPSWQGVLAPPSERGEGSGKHGVAV